MSTPVMILVGAAVLALAVALVWFFLVRASRSATVTEADFGDEYDELVAKGEIVDGDRDAAWRDFHDWQVANEKERLSWEEPSEE